MDNIHTQSAKIKQFEKRKIFLPQNAVFVPIDFNKESIGKILKINGFDNNKPALFILEGIIMYLSKDAVYKLFKEISNITKNGSKIVFDYIHESVLRKENRHYGEKSIYKTVNLVSESWTFGFVYEKVEEFLKSQNFSLIENLKPEDLENKYFTEKNGNRISRINGTHSVAFALKNRIGRCYVGR